MEYEKARTRMVDRGFVCVGVQVPIASWRSDVNTSADSFFDRTKRRIHLYGRPYHLWCRENITRTGNGLGEAVAIDQCPINYMRLDAAIIRIWRQAILGLIH